MKSFKKYFLFMALLSLVACGKQNTVKRDNGNAGNDLLSDFNNNQNGNFTNQNTNTGSYDFLLHSYAQSINIGHQFTLLMQNSGASQTDFSNIALQVSSGLSVNIVSNGCNIFLNSGENCTMTVSLAGSTTEASVTLSAILNAPSGMVQKSVSIAIMTSSGGPGTDTGTTPPGGTTPPPGSQFVLVGGTPASECFSQMFDGNGDGEQWPGLLSWSDEANGYLCMFEGPQADESGWNNPIEISPFVALALNPDSYCPNNWVYEDHISRSTWVQGAGGNWYEIDDENGTEICTKRFAGICTERKTFYPMLKEILCRK